MKIYHIIISVAGLIALGMALATPQGGVYADFEKTLEQFEQRDNRYGTYWASTSRYTSRLIMNQRKPAGEEEGLEAPKLNAATGAKVGTALAENRTALPLERKTSNAAPAASAVAGAGTEPQPPSVKTVTDLGGGVFDVEMSNGRHSAIKIENWNEILAQATAEASGLAGQFAFDNTLHSIWENAMTGAYGHYRNFYIDMVRQQIIDDTNAYYSGLDGATVAGMWGSGGVGFVWVSTGAEPYEGYWNFDPSGYAGQVMAGNWSEISAAADTYAAGKDAKEYANNAVISHITSNMSTYGLADRAAEAYGNAYSQALSEAWSGGVWNDYAANSLQTDIANYVAQNYARDMAAQYANYYYFHWRDLSTQQAYDEFMSSSAYTEYIATQQALDNAYTSYAANPLSFAPTPDFQKVWQDAYSAYMRPYEEAYQAAKDNYAGYIGQLAAAASAYADSIIATGYYSMKHFLEDGFYGNMAAYMNAQSAYNNATSAVDSFLSGADQYAQTMLGDMSPDDEGYLSAYEAYHNQFISDNQDEYGMLVSWKNSTEAAFGTEKAAAETAYEGWKNTEWQATYDSYYNSGRAEAYAPVEAAERDSIHASTNASTYAYQYQAVQNAYTTPDFAGAAQAYGNYTASLKAALENAKENYDAALAALPEKAYSLAWQDAYNSVYGSYQSEATMYGWSYHSPLTDYVNAHYGDIVSPSFSPLAEAYVAQRAGELEQSIIDSYAQDLLTNEQSEFIANRVNMELASYKAEQLDMIIPELVAGFAAQESNIDSMIPDSSIVQNTARDIMNFGKDETFTASSGGLVQPLGGDGVINDKALAGLGAAENMMLLNAFGSVAPEINALASESIFLDASGGQIDAVAMLADILKSPTEEEKAMIDAAVLLMVDLKALEAEGVDPAKIAEIKDEAARTLAAAMLAQAIPDLLKEGDVAALRESFAELNARKNELLKSYADSVKPYYDEIRKDLADNMDALQNSNLLSKELTEKEMEKLPPIELEKIIEKLRRAKAKGFAVEYILQQDAKYRKKYIDPNRATLQAGMKEMLKSFSSRITAIINDANAAKKTSAAVHTPPAVAPVQ